MRIAVYPHDLNVGGSQLNAIEIAAEVSAMGHSVMVVGQPGSLVQRIQQLGLEFVGLPAPSRRPSRRVALALRSLARDRQVDIVHSYEWPPTLEAVWASHAGGVPVISTVMSMAVAPFIPKSIPILVGTEQIAAAERKFGRRQVDLLEPPVDLRKDNPSLKYDIADFRRKHGIPDECLLVVVVTRLAHQLKLEGLLAAMTAVGRLRSEYDIGLVVVGDGPARQEVAIAAAAANSLYGDGTVILTGELFDPRPAYAAAEIALGMGGSALRAMAFAKPLVVQGEHGFWRTLTSDSVKDFLWAGWYGRGEGVETGVERLYKILRELLSEPNLRKEVACYGRRLVEQRFSLESAAAIQMHSYEAALAAHSRRWPTVCNEAAASARYCSYYLAKRIKRMVGIERTDDFNARPVWGRVRAEPTLVHSR
jgi:glycosyltransferase involved in cell wall biosynthesis